MKTLKNKVFIVTGAGSGMGRELTLQLAEKGVYVAACDIHKYNLEETLSLAKDPSFIKTYVLDVSDKKAVEAFPSTVKKEFQSLDGIINNAGIIQPFVHFMELKPETIEKVMNINFYGVINLTRATLKELDKDQEGFIINTSSMGGFLPVPGQGIYGASKAAVKLFTESLYAELKDTPIQVSVVFPGAIATNITNNSNSINQVDEKPIDTSSNASNHKTTSAKDAARIIIKGIEKGKLKIFVGSDAKLMDRLLRLMPVKAIDIMANMIKKMMT